MGKLSAVTQVALSVGLYKQVRALQLAFSHSQRRSYNEGRLLHSQFAKPGDLVFDVGANIDLKTELFLSLGARVIAFEPQAKYAREIAARAKGNEHLTIEQTAVGPKEGVATLHLTSSTGVASLLPNWNHGVKTLGTITVPVTTLDIAIEQFGVPASCKIDVEGFEAEVLRGLPTTIPNLSLEYHTWSREIKTINECMDILAKRQKYEVNMTGQESATFLLPHWLTIREFKDSFPDCAGGNLWGDVFIRPARH